MDEEPPYKFIALAIKFMAFALGLAAFFCCVWAFVKIATPPL